MGIIIKPIISEKMTATTEKFPERYGFRVSPKANKIEIKNAVESMYNVKVVSVNTSNVTPKLKVRYTKKGILRGRASAYKKAIVTLEKGQTINFFANI
ncbi:50S ribosomal protein L23 [Porphyromonas gingivicanis]|uniref:Large ribosomal subunit protein uL23 n=1 Tax=Porphyromonas gingivicanis TaxID=266762 RepID=A0A0A2G1Q9_9PORP|nr:50S ribosomal protein L23 [Porphyromonas gingivicanis]KGN97233.1 50S ribosomal protein L23 [Porphyromonas gingivicanis]